MLLISMMKSLVMHRFHGRKAEFISEQAGCREDRRRCGRYLQAGKEAFSAPAAGPFYSIVQDATRLGGLDMLYSALFSPSLELGMWLPPIALTFIDLQKRNAEELFFLSGNGNNRNRRITRKPCGG